jgi:hypothetical protein
MPPTSWAGVPLYLSAIVAMLTVAANPSGADSAAYYSLSPRANVWIQSSAPLNDVMGQCGVSTTITTPWCALPLVITPANGPSGQQVLYQGRVVGEITWASVQPAGQ